MKKQNIYKVVILGVMDQDEKLGGLNKILSFAKKKIRIGYSTFTTIFS